MERQREPGGSWELAPEAKQNESSPGLAQVSAERTAPTPAVAQPHRVQAGMRSGPRLGGGQGTPGVQIGAEKIR